jgi:hypothetical protein
MCCGQKVLQNKLTLSPMALMSLLLDYHWRTLSPCLSKVLVPSLLKPTLFAQVFMLATTFWCCLVAIQYHQFCASLHLESIATHCVNPTCGKPISNDWIVSFGFQHKSLLLKRPKQEKGCSIINTTRSI